MDKNMIVRLLFLLFALLNMTLTATGLNPIPVSDEVAYEIISIAAVIGASAWNAWKNNNFTPAAKAAQNVTDAIKSGLLTAEKVDSFLNENTENKE